MDDTKASCTIPTTAGYDFKEAAGSVEIKNFAPTGIVCASGYLGTPAYTLCKESGQPYGVFGCEAKATCAQYLTCKGVNRGPTFHCTGISVESCDEEKCCEPTATCDLFMGCKEPMPANKGASVHCGGTVTSCDVPTCCEAQATCEAYTLCIGTHSMNKGPTFKCSGGAASCNAETCCMARKVTLAAGKAITSLAPVMPSTTTIAIDWNFCLDVKTASDTLPHVVKCRTNTAWAMSQGYTQNHDWYRGYGINDQSSFADFQCILWDRSSHDCMRPCTSKLSACIPPTTTKAKIIAPAAAKAVAVTTRSPVTTPPLPYQSQTPGWLKVLTICVGLLVMGLIGAIIRTYFHNSTDIPEKKKRAVKKPTDLAADVRAHLHLAALRQAQQDIFRSFRRRTLRSYR